MRLVEYRFTTANRLLFLRNMFIRHSLMLVAGLCFHVFMLWPLWENSELFGSRGIIPLEFDLVMFWGVFASVSVFISHWMLRFARLKVHGKVNDKVGQIDVFYLGILPFYLYLVSCPLHPIGGVVGMLTVIFQGYYLLNSDIDDFLRLERHGSYRKQGIFRQRKRLETEVLPFSLFLLVTLVVMGMQNAAGYCNYQQPRYWLVLVYSMLSTTYCLVIWCGIIHEIWQRQSAMLQVSGKGLFRRLMHFVLELSWSFWMELGVIAVMAGLLAHPMLRWLWMPMMILQQFILFHFIWRAGGSPKQFWNWLMEHPVQMLVSSFGLLIVTGGAVLSFPICSATEESVGVVNALFTATSAVCVTGLIVRDTATAFSPLGKFVIITLIQLGALGIMSLSGFVALLIGRKFGLRGEEAMKESTGTDKSLEAKALIKTIILCTVLIETTGGVMLMLYFMFRHSMEVPQAFAYGFFHSISAFCNAGFALYSDNLESFGKEPYVLIVISFLIIFGGMGFGVFRGLFRRLFDRRQLKLDVHARLVLVMTAALCVVGTLLLYMLECHHSLAGMGFADGICNAWFQAVSPRTAGFNSINLTAMTNASLLVVMVLMFIGAAPGSTGGGIKVTTMAVLLLLIRSWISGESEVNVGGRTVAPRTIRQATAVFLLAGIVVLTGTLILSIDMPGQSLIPIMYEVISALGTVGLSIGVTAELTTLGKFVIIAIMFLGRVGPLTFLVALSSRRECMVHYPEARINIG